MATLQFSAEVVPWIAMLAEVLDARQQARFAPLCLGLLFARGRRTVAAWLRAAGCGDQYRLYYYCLGSLGRKTEAAAARLLHLVARCLPQGGRIVLALDDSPTKRYGPHVQGAGIHHNPTPGPADQEFLYGHIWVTLAWLVRHPRWGTIALPLLARLYIRAKDVPRLVPWYRWKFRTKLELAAELVAWAAHCLTYVAGVMWVVVDGAYAKRPFLKAARACGAVVVSRLRRDAALYHLPPAPGQQRGRGRPRTYGKQRISLAKRAGQKGGWQTEEFTLYGKRVKKRFKTFLATYRPAAGVIQVVLVKNDDASWVAFFCTDTDASVADILEAVADRAAIEQVFHDVKEVHGAGQQQLRNVWANVAAWHLNLWMHTLIEVWAWGRSHAALCDRTDRPWDDPARRPSHADRRNALRRECLREEFLRLAPRHGVTRKIRHLVHRLTKLVA